MSMELDKLVKQVAETKAAEESIIALLDNIKLELESVIGELEEEKADTSTLERLRDDLDKSEQNLLNAVKDPPVFSNGGTVDPLKRDPIVGPIVEPQSNPQSKTTVTPGVKPVMGSGVDSGTPAVPAQADAKLTR